MKNDKLISLDKVFGHQMVIFARFGDKNNSDITSRPRNMGGIDPKNFRIRVEHSVPSTAWWDKFYQNLEGFKAQKRNLIAQLTSLG